MGAYNKSEAFYIKLAFKERTGRSFWQQMEVKLVLSKDPNHQMVELDYNTIPRLLGHTTVDPNHG